MRLKTGLDCFPAYHPSNPPRAEPLTTRVREQSWRRRIEVMTKSYEPILDSPIVGDHNEGESVAASLSANTENVVVARVVLGVQCADLADTQPRG